MLVCIKRFTWSSLKFFVKNVPKVVLKHFFSKRGEDFLIGQIKLGLENNDQSKPCPKNIYIFYQFLKKVYVISGNFLWQTWNSNEASPIFIMGVIYCFFQKGSQIVNFSLLMLLTYTSTLYNRNKNWYKP